MVKSSKRSWRSYAFEFLSIFVAVISAFALNNWNENRKERHAESKILSEILHGLDQDLMDVNLNIAGHEDGLNGCQFWTNLLLNKPQEMDSLQHFYMGFTRDYISLFNTSGFETLKSRGFEIIQNDSLRSKVITLYEFHYQLLSKLEEDYSEMQFSASYFESINEYIAPNFQFDENAMIIGIDLPFKMSDDQRSLLLSYLWKIRVNRRFILHYYQDVKKKITALQKDIESELNSR